MQFIATEGRNFGSYDEFVVRAENWLETDNFIKKHNSDPTSMSTVGHNQFSDYTEEDWSKMHGLVDDPEHDLLPEHLVTNLAAATSKDWRGKCQSPVKNQGAC